MSSHRLLAKLMLISVAMLLISGCARERRKEFVSYSLVISDPDPQTHACYQYMAGDPTHPVQLLEMHEGDTVSWSQQSNKKSFNIAFKPGLTWFGFPGTPFKDDQGNWRYQFPGAASSAVPSGAAVLTLTEAFGHTFYYDSVSVDGNTCFQGSGVSNDIGVIVKP
jgi:hypothetical protein